MNSQRKLKPWQSWAIFGGSMVVVFCLGLLAASVTERRAEIASIYANKKGQAGATRGTQRHVQGQLPTRI